MGWNENEFQALGIPYAERGKRTDETLALIRAAFASDAITINGVTLPALPRPRHYVSSQLAKTPLPIDDLLS